MPKPQISEKTNSSGRNKKPVLSRRIPRIGHVVFTGGDVSVQCAVKNFTRQGAVLTMSGWLGLPSGFTLFVEPDSIRTECRVLRRKGNNIEVEFTSLEENVRYRSGGHSRHSSSVQA